MLLTILMSAVGLYALLVSSAYLFVKLKLPRDAQDRWNSCNREEFCDEASGREKGEGS